MLCLAVYNLRLACDRSQDVSLRYKHYMRHIPHLVTGRIFGLGTVGQTMKGVWFLDT